MPTFSHSKLTVIKVGAVDISSYCNTSDFPRTAEASDVSTYGTNSKIYQTGLKDGTYTMGGFTVVSPAASGSAPSFIFGGHEGDLFSIIRQPEGTGTGKAQQSFSAILTNYQESNPVSGYIAWTANFQKSGDVTITTQ